jgi:hypothetical protein
MSDAPNKLRGFALWPKDKHREASAKGGAGAPPEFWGIGFGFLSAQASLSSPFGSI